MSIGSFGSQSDKESLSALVDGEEAPTGVSRACADWAADADARKTWHAYHLIGDVLRSEDLASGAARDARFMASLQARLAAEPIVLAPEPAVMPAVAPSVAAAPRRFANGARSRRWSWVAPSAVAAGFVAVAGALMVTRPSGEGSQPVATVAERSREATAVMPVTSRTLAPATAAVPASVAPGIEVLRDPMLDRYLAAHKQFAGSSALGTPSRFLRNAVVETPQR